MSFHTGILYSLPAFILWLSYYLVLYYRVKHAPLSTTIGTYNATRTAWTIGVMKNNLDILAVQTLRNWSLSATFLASTGSLLALATLNFLLDPEALATIALRHNTSGLSDTIQVDFFRAKVLLLMIVMFFSFFNFTLSIRYYNKAGFILCIRESNIIKNHQQYAVRTVFNGALHYMLGMRSYYLTVPLVLWLLGNAWLYVGMLLLILVQFRTDYRP
ncbi:MAG: DUF599 domain-containing protein [Aquificaceae bacterium]|nr:MAG: DUF599 domain-containing protein [Aquificaceae bacterium]